MNHYILYGCGLLLFAGSGIAAWDSAEVSALFLKEQFNFPRLGYVIAGSVIVLGFVVSLVKEHKNMYRNILALMIVAMLADAGTNVLAKLGDVKAAEASLDIRSKAIAEISFLDVEINKLEDYKPKLSSAMIPKTRTFDSVSVAQAIVSSEGYPTSIDGKWGKNTEGAISDYSTWVKQRLSELTKTRKSKDLILEETEAALEFSMTKGAAYAFGIGMTLGGWVLSFVGGFLLSIGPKPDERQKNIAKQDKKAASVIVSASEKLREQAAANRAAAEALKTS